MLSISYEFRRGILFIRLIGELTKDTSWKLKHEITDMIKDNGITNVVFNLSKIIYIDDTGVNNFLENFTLCKKNNGSALLCGVNNNIKMAFRNNKYSMDKIIDDELSAFGKIVI